MMKRGLRVVLLGAVAGLAACGGGGGTGGSTPPVHTSAPTPTPTAAPMAKAVVAIDWPSAQAASVASVGAKSSRSAKPLYISTFSQGVNIYTAAGGGSPVFQVGIQNPCGGTGTGVVNPSSHGSSARPQSCTSTSTTIGLPAGSTTFYSYSYDAWDPVHQKGMGSLLAATTTNTNTINVLPPPAVNTVTLTMSGVVASVSYSGLPLASGTGSGSWTPAVSAYDADGGLISGNYANPITVQFSDPGAAFTWSGYPATITASGQSIPQFSKGASSDCVGNLTSTAPSYVDANVSGISGGGVASAITQLESIGSAGASAGNWFGRVQVCWPALSGASSYYIYRSTSSGGETNPYIAQVVGNGATVWQDYNTSPGANYYYVICSTSTIGTPSSPTCSAETNKGYTQSTNVQNIAGTAPVYWFDANDTSQLVGYPGTITQWNDKSGNGNNMAVTGLTYTTNVYNIPTRVGLTAASGTYGTVQNGSLQASNSNPLTIFVVASQSAANGSSFERLISLGYQNDKIGFVGTAGASYPGQAASFFGNTLTTGNGACNGWCDTLANGPLTSWSYNLPQNVNYPAVFDVFNDGSCPGPLAPIQICGVNTSTISGDTGGPIAYFNGGDGIASNGVVSMNQTHNGTMTSTTGMYVGATYTAGAVNTSQSWIGNVDEIIVYNVSLTTAQRQTIEGYLGCKWGAQYAFASGHPYGFGQSCP